MKTNPNGANQYQLDPRQKLCWESYVNPKSATFGNAKQSALNAGYEEDTACQITVAQWFIDKTRRLNLLTKAEAVLEKTLNYSTDMVLGEGIVSVNDKVLRIQADVAKFLAERLNKEDYSNRTEQTGKGGEPLIPEKTASDIDIDEIATRVAAEIKARRIK